MAHPHEHTPPTGIVEVDAVLVDPSLSDLEMPAIVFLVPVGNQDPAGFPRLHDRYDLIGLGALEVRVHEIVPPTFRGIQDRYTPLLRASGDPVLELIRHSRQETARDALALSIGVEEANHPLRLLERLNASI